jgi:arylsulfatase
MTDDVGFAASSTFGGPIPTPNFEALANNGARYNQFNTTAICSPTRASLMTGREPHNVNMGNVNNLATGYDGYTSVIPTAAGTVAQALRANGYTTAAFGKWHLTPEWEQSSFGPFNHWPTGMGFDYFYGFHGGDTDQYSPALFQNTIPIAPPSNDSSYILDHDLATKAIGWIQQQKAVAPDHPFFVYYAPGTAHSPHSAPKEWIARFKGKFDQGWDELRRQSFARQKALGVIPPDAKLTPRPDFLPAWASLTADQKRLYARMMEVYAAALAFNDEQVGRLIDSLKASGEYENTLIIFIQGDNGASAEGGLQGLHTEESMINGFHEDFEWLLKHIDDLGGPNAHNHFPAPWAWALNTPFQYYKKVASHAGGVRNGMVISWPGHINDPNIVRRQFLHVSDVSPTILEAAGIPIPSEIGGVRQMPVDGISFAYTFNNAFAAPRRSVQMFEMMQNAAIYDRGWVAATKPEAAPWEITTKSLDIDFSKRTWELYNLDQDFSEANNLAASDPAKLAELKEEFMREAAANHVLPIHGVYDGAAGRPSLGAQRMDFIYRGRVSRVPENTAPRTLAHSFTITADVDIPTSGGNGVVVAQGGRFGGYALYLKGGRVTFHYNTTGDRQYRIVGISPVPAGNHTITADFAIDKPEPGQPGTLTLRLDGQVIGTGRIENTYRTWFSNSEGFDVGEDTLTPVSDEYTASSSVFNGTIRQIEVKLR